MLIPYSAFNAQGSRLIIVIVQLEVIIVVVQLEAVKILYIKATVIVSVCVGNA
jgi:hypothetical protein